MPSSIKRLGALVAVVLSLATTAASGTVLFEYRSTCAINCASIGLSAGDAVGGVVGFTDAAVAFGVAFGPADVEVFDVTFGTFTFDLASLGSAFAVFTGFEPNAFVFEFITSAAGSDPGYNFTETSWIAGPSAATAAGGGLGTLTRIPEPASLALLLGGLAAGIVVRRRTRA